MPGVFNIGWEKQSPPRSQNLRPLTESVFELQEMVKEYVTLNYLDIIWDGR